MSETYIRDGVFLVTTEEGFYLWRKDLGLKTPVFPNGGKMTPERVMELEFQFGDLPKFKIYHSHIPMP